MFANPSRRTAVEPIDRPFFGAGRATLAIGVLTASLSAPFTLVADERTGTERVDPAAFIEEITIVGDRDTATRTPGAAHYIGPDELAQFGYADVQRIARQIPGVSIQIEDGYGLRPNISIRGVATERSGRITLLEDGVMIAPAPYSAPSAYYFPTAGRMYAFEVLKGPSAITEGPYTIGGALNMISTPIPSKSQGLLSFEAGEDSTYRAHASYGASSDTAGFLVETHQWQSDGFQSVDRGGDSGLDVRDYTAKFAWRPNGGPHAIELKLQKAEQTSDQSYLGLTDRDFSTASLRRYGISMLDQIETDHDQVILRYQYDLSSNAQFSLTAYDNRHSRDWFKTEGIDFDGSESAETFSRTSWFNVIQAINGGAPIGDASVATLNAILDGSADTAVGSIQLRSNNREYFSRGIQMAWTQGFTTGDMTHELEVGLRYHEDEEDRLQRNSTYHQENGRLVLDDIGLLGNAGNRIQSAEAIAIHVFDRITMGRWLLTPGVRFEDIDQARVRYEIRSGRTSDPSSRDPSNLRSTRSNSTQVVLPGLGVRYALTDELAIIGGIHEGFTAPSNSPGVEEERALNYEFGFRYDRGELAVEAIGFVSDYDNLLGECTSSSGADCEIGDAFNGDAVAVRGVEFLGSANLAPMEANVSVPVSLTYSYIDGSFDTDIADTNYFGDVTAGDPIPYIPKHQAVASIGLLRAPWAVHLSANFVDAVCVRASCGVFEQTDSSTTLDMSAHWDVSEQLTAFLRVENLTDSLDIMGRHPYGARPNRSRTSTLGVRYAF